MGESPSGNVFPLPYANPSKDIIQLMGQLTPTPQTFTKYPNEIGKGFKGPDQTPAMESPRSVWETAI